jgi:hypothetical protein
MPTSNIFKQPFAEQVDFFRKKINFPSDRWDDIEKSAHDRAFIVAGANKADLVADLRNTIDKCIAEGKSLGWYQKNFDEIVKKHGWTGWTGEGTKAGHDWRTTITYQTNMSTSYASGRWKQLHDPDLVKLRPYLTYHHADGVRHPRPLHQSWNGFTAPRDHPFFQTHACPNGWCCHCYLSASSEADYTSAKAEGRHQPPEGWDKIDPKTGDPVGIDKGFGYAPGANANRPLKHFIDQKLINLDAPIGAAMWQSIKPILKAEQSAAVREMVAQAAASMEPAGASVVAHIIEPDTVVALAGKGIELQDSAIWLRDHELIHALRDSKDARGAALPMEVWLSLADYLESAKPYLDKVNGTLLYAFDLPGVTGKVVVRVNHSKKVKDGGKRKIIASNFIVTGGIINPDNLIGSVYVQLAK